jgi:hypothetical protein
MGEALIGLEDVGRWPNLIKSSDANFLFFKIITSFLVGVQTPPVLLKILFLDTVITCVFSSIVFIFLCSLFRRSIESTSNKITSGIRSYSQKTSKFRGHMMTREPVIIGGNVMPK